MTLKHTQKSTSAGFTLLEVLLVVAIIAVLATISIIAISPGRQLATTRNAARASDVEAIAKAINQYVIDNGSLPAAVTSSSLAICKTSAASCAGMIDLSSITSNGKYIPSVPIDPSCKTICPTNSSGYNVYKGANNRIYVTSPHAENGAAINVTF